MVINTTNHGRDAERDGFKIRRSTVEHAIACLTSLDTATRLARFMFQEFWLEPGETPKDIKGGFKKLMVNPYFATILTVVLGVLLGMNGFMKI